jgi:hypothetical protein
VCSHVPGKNGVQRAAALAIAAVVVVDVIVDVVVVASGPAALTQALFRRRSRRWFEFTTTQFLSAGRLVQGS